MLQRLTIILPLKGRPLFTLRFLYHANRTKVPYHFLIADGEVREPLSQILEDASAHFPNLSIEYIRYPDDSRYSDFYRKMADVSGRVHTPYAMLADNDDFLGVNGIEQMLNFLEGSPSHSCSTGRVGGFGVHDGFSNRSGGVTGRVNRYFDWYTPVDVSQESAQERIRDGGHLNWTYYAVVRTSALATIEREAAEIDFSDLAIHETYHSMRMFSLGRARFDPASVTYFRQFGTSSSGIYHFDWGRYLVYGRLTSDIAMAVERVSAGVSTDAQERSIIAEQLRQIILGKYRPLIATHFGPRQVLKRWLHRKWPLVLAWYQNMPRVFPGRERAAFFETLRASGATPAYLQQFQAELEAVEGTLSGQDFRRFLAHYLPLFAASAARSAYTARPSLAG
jgi:glycosyltransferase domain-containing protein